MFRSYYGLSFNPFDKQNAREKDRFLSRDISEMMSRLDYLKDTRGIGLFTARPGMGKSFALRCFARSLNPNLYHMEYICLSTVSVMEFYRQLCSVLGVEPGGGKPGMFRAVQEQIFYLYKDKKQPLLLAVDEAQYLSTGILEDIKMLMNYGYDSLNCFTLILCGEPHLNSTLKKPVHEALRQRITVHYNFSGLSDSEVAQYILHKISCAGGAASIIDQAALSAVHSHSQGSPRLVDNLMTDALTLGAQMDKKVIDTDVILASVSSQNLGQEVPDMKYDCILRHGSHRETWTGELILLGMGDGWYEAEINGRGTYFHILTGRHRYGNYLCIPNHDVGCELSDFSDIFWNEERIGSLMRKVDAVTVATGLVHLPAMASGRLKN